MLRTLLAGSSRAASATASTSSSSSLCWCQRAISTTASASSEIVARYPTPGALENAPIARALVFGANRPPGPGLTRLGPPVENDPEEVFAVREVHLPVTPWPESHIDAKLLPPSTVVALPEYVFDSPARPDILHQCVRAHLSSLRQGTARTKNRAEVRGSQRKIMRQKGTGKARVGDAHSPIRRGGGRAFPKRQKDWTLGLNRKVWELGVRTALSERWRRGELTVIPASPGYDTVSTRELVSSLHSPVLAMVPVTSLAPSHKTVPKVLFLLSEVDPNFVNSARNLETSGVRVMDVRDVDIYPLLLGSRVVLDIDAAQILCDRFGKSDINDKMTKHFTGYEAGYEPDSMDERNIDVDNLNEYELYEYERYSAKHGGEGWERQANAAQASNDAVMSVLTQSMQSTTLGSSTAEQSASDGGSRDGQTSSETDGGIKEQDVVIEGEEAGVQEKRHPEDPLQPGADQDKGDAIRNEMDTAAKQQKKVIDSEDRPNAKDVL